MPSDMSQDEPLPVPPFVPIEGLVNVRDIGGYEVPAPTKDGRPCSVRRGLVYRGSEPGRITPDGRAAFKALGIKKVYDIRTEEELPPKEMKPANPPQAKSFLAEWQSPIVEIEGVERIYLDVLGDSSVPKDREARAQAYQELKKDSTEVLDRGAILKPIFEHLAKPHPEPIYLHCTAGKDRTGTIIMLLLRLVGISPETAAEEYELTNLGLREEAPRLVEKMLKAPEMSIDAETLKNIMVAKREYIVALCKVLDEEYGGAEQYLRSYLKMSAVDVQAMRHTLVTDEPPVFPKRQETHTGGLTISRGHVILTLFAFTAIIVVWLVHDRFIVSETAYQIPKND
ncbi:MAG: hypothetical protein Q9224_003430 [Gallowayella concinna]